MARSKRQKAYVFCMDMLAILLGDGRVHLRRCSVAWVVVYALANIAGK